MKHDLTDEDRRFRAQHVGASEVSALFGCNPWVTHFELWHRKAGNIAAPDLSANERVEWGMRLEPVIIAGAADRWGYEVETGADRVSNGEGLGGHPDVRAICPERGPGILEVKCVDWLVVKEWGEEPPLHYLLQGNTYAGLTASRWFDLVVLVGGNELRRFQYEYRPKLFAEAEKRTAEFWASIAAGTPPPADYAKDKDAIAALYPKQTAAVVNLEGDNLAASAAAEYLAAKELVKAAEARVEAAEAELRDKLGDAAEALVSGFYVKTSAVAGVPDREITADMVGNIIKGRKGYRRLYVKERK
jgi:predicted phage-related endonuclease